MSTIESVPKSALAKGLKLCLISLLLMLGSSTLSCGVRLSNYSGFELLRVIPWIQIASTILMFMGVRGMQHVVENPGLRNLARWLVVGLGAALMMHATAWVLWAIDNFAVSLPRTIYGWINYTLIEHVLLFLYLVLIVGMGSQIRMVQFRFSSFKVLRLFLMYFAWIGFELYGTVQLYLRGDSVRSLYLHPLVIYVYLFIYFFLALYTWSVLRAAKKLELAPALAPASI